jgi:D-alanine--poly(phosphoribitol) ligase subunit 1
MTETFDITPSDRFSQHPNLAFDISMTDIFGALCHGARLCLLSGETDRLMPARMVAREGVTIWNSVPSVVSLMDQAGQVTAGNLASVRIFNFCGEPLLQKQVEILFEACPGALVRNTYGPTEATIAVTDLPMEKHSYRPPSRDSISIGPPIGDIGLHLIGGDHPDEGELAITGEQLADGYWQDEEKTARAFRNIDVGGRPTRAYFTGDWIERIDGQLYFRERIDFQVKVKGFRVELDEVAGAIRSCGWPVVCVFKRGDALAAVVEHREGQAFDSKALMARLRLMLEDYAVPVAIRKIDHLPRNENDKLDRKAAAAWFDAQMVGV